MASSIIRNILIFASLATAESHKKIFERPVINRVWQQHQYTQKNYTNISEVAIALADLKPSYVSTTIELAYGVNLTDDMISGFHHIRDQVHRKSPHAKFDIMLNLSPTPTAGHNVTYPNAQAVVDKMKYLNSKLSFDSFFFDFLSTAELKAPEWVRAATKYAHSQKQLVGGNVFGSVIPPNVDFVAFDDRRNTSDAAFGYGIDKTQVEGLKHNRTKHDDVMILGHINNNPQNDPNTTLSCVYINEWNATRRAEYQRYWVEEQKKLGFKYMLPLFFPECPGARTYDPLHDVIDEAKAKKGEMEKKTVYDYIRALGFKHDK